MRDLFEPHVTDDVAALIRIVSIVVGSGRWADRAAGTEFERSIRRASKPSVRTRA